MFTPLFGWSAGDVVQSIKIIIKIVEAFKETGGAATKFAETTAFLDHFNTTLNRIKEYASDNTQAKYSATIVDQIKLIDNPYCTFEKYMLEFEPALGEVPTEGRQKKAKKKIKWAMKELSEVSGKVAELKKAVTEPLVFVGQLLLLQTLDSIDGIVKNLPTHPTQSDLNSLRDAIISSSIPDQLFEQIDSLNRAVSRQGSALEAQSRSLVRLTRCLSEKDKETRATISKENEKNQQHRISENLTTITRIEALVSDLEKKFDPIINALLILEQNRSKRDRQLEESLQGQRTDLAEVKSLTEASAGRIAELVETLETIRLEAKYPQQMERTQTWVFDCCRQLVASGITSAMTGVVVYVAMRSDSSSAAPAPEQDSAPKSVTDSQPSPSIIKETSQVPKAPPLPQIPPKQIDTPIPETPPPQKALSQSTPYGSPISGSQSYHSSIRNSSKSTQNLGDRRHANSISGHNSTSTPQDYSNPSHENTRKPNGSVVSALQEAYVHQSQLESNTVQFAFTLDIQFIKPTLSADTTLQAQHKTIAIVHSQILESQTNQ
ncbi:hypothetical protein MMC28_006337 [Mycoblastus sanguinarius]|nr:hypothetical protein [Mycoblastus sanguinarius]